LNAPVLVNYAKDTSFIAIMAVGMTAVIVSAGIDLSVGATYALAGVCGAMVLHSLGPVGANSPLAATVLGILTTVGVAVACGLLNGLAVVSLRVHPFIITLGTMKIFRGIAFVATGAESIGDFPRMMTGLVRDNLGLGGSLQPVPLLVLVLTAIAGTVYLSHMVAGRHVYAVGGNMETARFSGLRTRRIIVSVYVICGLCAGVASVLANGVYGSAMCSRGDGYELNVIAAAVVGGASLSGGRGTALGAVLGAMLIQLIEQSIITLGINQDYNQIIIGSAVVLAVVLDQVSRGTTSRRLTAAPEVS
ncbi:MAG: ABC transporter permease, partial [Planctomycetes bacterium]|nr:ABC transporter permease [Planctomycetota bacterium]